MENANVRKGCIIWKEQIPESKARTVETFKGISCMRRKCFDKSSNALSKLAENDIGSKKMTLPQ